MALLLKRRIYSHLRLQQGSKDAYYQIIKKLNNKKETNLKTLRIDIRQHPDNLDKIVDFSTEGYGIWFACGGVMAVGGASPEIMDFVIAPAKRYTVKVYNKKLLSLNKKTLSVPWTRKFEKKPPIILVSLDYMFQVVDMGWLARKYGLKYENFVKDLLEKLYHNTLLHMVLPIKKEYYDLFPYNKNNPTKDKMITAGFMCLGGYPPLKEFVVRHEKKSGGKIKGLPWPFMGTSLTHDSTEAVITAQQAHEYLEELGHEAKKIIVILEDSKLDFIVENEWKKGGSQSIIDLVNGEDRDVLILRRGTAVPELARDILSKFNIKLIYKHDFKDLFKDQESPISTQKMMEEFINRLKL